MPRQQMVKQIIYYTDNRLDGTKLCSKVRGLLKSFNIPIISVSQKPINFGENYVYKGERSQLAIMEQVWIGLMKSKADMIYLAEHDCLYHPSHFDLISDTICYDDHWYRCSTRGYYWLGLQGILLSTCFGPRLELIKGIASKLFCARKMGAIRYVEPGVGTDAKLIPIKRTRAKFPMICVRHDKNWGLNQLDHPEQFKVCPIWGDYKILREKLGL